MNFESLPNAPRCFGFASAYGADDAICSRCKVNEQCKPIAQQNLIELQALIDIGGMKTMHLSTSSGVKKETIRIVTEKPKSSGKNLDMVNIINNIADPTLLRAGENPFSISVKPPYLRPMAQLILTGEATIESLIEILTKNFNHALPKATELVLTVQSALTEIGVITEHEGRIQII